VYRSSKTFPRVTNEEKSQYPQNGVQKRIQTSEKYFYLYIGIFSANSNNFGKWKKQNMTKKRKVFFAVLANQMKRRRNQHIPLQPLLCPPTYPPTPRHPPAPPWARPRARGRRSRAMRSTCPQPKGRINTECPGGGFPTICGRAGAQTGPLQSR